MSVRFGYTPDLTPTASSRAWKRKLTPKTIQPGRASSCSAPARQSPNSLSKRSRAAPSRAPASSTVSRIRRGEELPKIRSDPFGVSQRHPAEVKIQILSIATRFQPFPEWLCGSFEAAILPNGRNPGMCLNKRVQVGGVIQNVHDCLPASASEVPLPWTVLSSNLLTNFNLFAMAAGNGASKWSQPAQGTEARVT